MILGKLLTHLAGKHEVWEAEEYLFCISHKVVVKNKWDNHVSISSETPGT